MSTTVELIDAELQILPLAELHESPLNPRTYFAEAKLKELADSIKVAGVRVPLVCRPRFDGGGYEIGAGHRRYRAAKLAGVERVPVIVRDMTDLDFLDMLAFENGNREDLHPLEEAAGWQAWMRETLSDVPALIAKTGHKLGYVYGRLKLLDAIDEAKRACWEDKIKPGHLLLIARLDAKDQLNALRYCQPPEWAPEADVSVRDLAQWIKKNVNVALDLAPFDREDPYLVAAAGSCGPCMYRSGNAPDFNLLEDLPNICTRRSCYEDKVAAHLATVPKPYFPEPPAAPTPAPAPAPKPAGQTAEERKQEAARRKKEQEEEAERQRAWAEQQERERAAAKQKIDAEKAVRSKIIGAILSNVEWPPQREDVLPLLICISLPGELADPLQMAEHWDCYAIEQLSDRSLARLIVLNAVADDFDGDFAFGRGCDSLNAAAKRYGVNPAEFRKPAKAKEDGTRREVIKQLPAVGTGGKKPAKPPAKKAPAKKAAKPATAKKGKSK